MTGYSTGAASRVHSAIAYLAFAACAIAGLLVVFALQHSTLFAVAASGYIAVAVPFEERDVHRQLRHVYSNYAVRRNETKAGLS